MMIRITDTPKPRDRFGSIPIREGKPTSNFASRLSLPKRPKRSFLWPWLKRLVALFLGTTLLLVICSPLLVPYLATTLLATHLAETLNRPVTIAGAEFNPLTSTLTLRRFIVGPQRANPEDPVDPLLSAGRISIACGPKQLPAGELACTLAADHVFLHLVRRKDGGYNFGQSMADLLPGMQALPLRFSWSTIAMDNSRLVYDDEQTGKTHHAEDLTLTFSPGQPNPLRLQGEINSIPITLNDAANQAWPTDPGADTGAPNTPDDPATKTAAAIALVQELSQAAGEYLEDPISRPAARRLETSPAP